MAAAPSDAENRWLLHQPAAGPGITARTTRPAPDMLSESRSLPPPPSRPPWPARSMLSLPGDQGWQLPAQPGGSLAALL